MPFRELAVLQAAPTVDADDQPPAETAARLRAVARESFAAADTAKAREHLRAFLALYRPTETSGGRDPSEAYLWSQRLAQVAQEYLRAGLLKDALEVLGEAADLDLPPDEAFDDGLASAAAGLHRRLAALDADERYQLVRKWTMPTESRRRVRILNSLVPHDAPPKAFALALGERPRDDSFPICEINGVRGLFSSAWLLVTSAAECGRLRRLASELAPLADGEVPNARYVLTLAEIVQGEPDDRLVRELSQQVTRVELGIPTTSDGKLRIDSKDLVTAAACLGDRELVPFGERMLKSLIEYTYGGESMRTRAFLRAAHATAVRNRLAGVESGILDDPQLPLWLSCQSTTARLNAMGCVPATWLAHEDHILHLAGPDNSLLYFRYPLTGEFEFSFDTQDGGRGGTEGGVEFGGLGFEVWSGGQTFKARDADSVNIAERPSPFVPDDGRERFHRLAIRSTDNGFIVLSNGHPVWHDASGNNASGNNASPWLALRSFRDRRPAFRNFKLSGSPTIPREVRMSEGNVLRGWRAGYYGERLPSPFSASGPDDRSSDGWYLDKGIIHGGKRAGSSGGQSRLEYARPLCDGESVSYEFRYQVGEFEVHPALGRLAFLIEPGGVRIHWMTDGVQEWTGLAEDNAVAEPLDRRGPKPLPLVAGDWNRATISLAGDKMTLSLNDILIYQRTMEPTTGRTFGFFRDPTKSAQIRDVVLRGDWPERLSDAQLSNLVAISADRTTAERHALHALIEEPNLAANVFEVRRRASKLDKDARLRYLIEWVLPGENHPGFRLAGDFTPTSPPPNAAEAHTRNSNELRLQVGGELVSPALDLVDLAQELQMLDVLQARIEQAEASVDEGEQQRAHAALLSLIAIARNDSQAAQSHMERLFDLLHASGYDLEAERWPETIAMSRGVHYPPTRQIVGECLNLINDLYNTSPRGWTSNRWLGRDHYFFTLLGTHKYYGTKDAASDRFTSAPQLKNWVPVSYATSKTRGEGQPRPHWQLGDKRVDKLSGHDFDYLMFRIPLQGDYEVECDLTAFAWRNTQLMAAGTWAAPHSGRVFYELGTFRESLPRRALEPKLGHTDEFVRVRAVVRDGACTTYYNGRKLHEEPLPAEADPWLAVRNWSRYHGAVRDLRIAGNPVIPEQINLAASSGLPGWMSYFDDTVGAAGDWSHDGDSGITGTHKRELAGTIQEGLLRYHRPMLEDGTIDYEFYYQPGQADVHPALDRLAFMLEPEGVRIHWVTDGKYDRTGANPANRLTEADNRRGPERLPLNADTWNRLRLTLRGDNVSLELNEQLVYERALEPTNGRTFGLFHYADQTETRVRNIVWRGNWPRELPALAEQELAEDTGFLDQRLPELTAVFEHDFASGGLPDTYFRTSGDDVEQSITVEKDGIHVIRASEEDWARAIVNPRIRARGDFDITAAFEQLETSAARPDARTPLAASIDMLGVLGGAAGKHNFTVIQRDEPDERRVLLHHVTLTQANGSRSDAGSRRANEASSGRFRLARRGEHIYFLFAEADSPMFRLLGAETAPTDDVVTLRLGAEARGTGRVSVVWKRLSIRAEQLMHMSDPQPPVLFVMSADGKELRQLTKPIGDLGSHASPAWSPDGRRIAFDTFKNSTDGSHIFLIDPDGSDLTDLGLGSMPTFSPDGKRIAFSWTGRGITVMDADGENREILDPSGWGAQWSPDGKAIAYSGGNITLLEPATKGKRTILEGDQAQRYSYVYWNMTWSRDSSQICFLGRTRVGGSYEIAIANAAGSSNGFQVLYASESELQTDFSWHPAGKQILCTMRDPGLGGQRLFTLDVGQEGPPKLLPTQPLDHNNTSPDWSPDGKYIVFSSRPPDKWKKVFQTEEAEGQGDAGERE